MGKTSVILCLFFIISLNSQNQKNSKSNTYEFESYEKRKIDSIISSYKNQQKKSWLNLLPSFNYDLKNQSVNVGVSLNSFASFYQQKKRNKIELAKYEHSLKEKLDKDLQQLQLSIEQFKIDLRILSNAIELFKIDFDLFQISKGKYKNNEITTEDFLKLKQAFLHKKNSLKTSLLKLELKAKAISLKTKSDLLIKSLNILSNSINNYD